MNIRKTIIGAGAAAIIILAAAVPAFSQQRPHGPAGPGQPGPVWHPMMQSQLTPEQQRQAASIYREYQNATATTRERLWAQELRLMAALAEDRIDENRVNSLVGAINNLRSNLYAEQVKMYLELARADLMYPVMGNRGMMGMGMGGGMMGFCPMMGPGMMDMGAWPAE